VLLPHRGLRNIYVRELGRAYLSLGVNPLFGPVNLFESDFVPDLLHLHWPEEVYRSLQEGALEHRVERLLDRLDRLRADGTRIAWTVHNVVPHETATAEIASRAYQGVIDHADVVHHHCPASEATLRARYRIPDGQKHVVVPHGHYASYANDMTPAGARRSLGIDPSRFVFLHFGQIRDYKGVDIVEYAFRRLRSGRKHLVVAGGVNLSLSRLDRARDFALRRLSRRRTYALDSIRNDDVQRYFLSCDAVVLGHTSGLNSGVAVLAMTFGKPVIGPRLGCIEWVLAQGSNLLYDSGDAGALQRAMDEAMRLDLEAVAAVNRRVTAGWTWEAIAARVLEACAAGPIDSAGAAR
jgi:beta-1,4-mannosyltransferase